MPTKKKPMNNETIDTFVLAFMGEFVSVVTDIMIVDYAQSDENTLEKNAPLIAQGYLLDCDEIYLYLGENPLEVTQAIVRNKVLMVQIDRKKSRYEELLDEMGDPNKREDIN